MTAVAPRRPAPSLLVKRTLKRIAFAVFPSNKALTDYMQQSYDAHTNTICFIRKSHRFCTVFCTRTLRTPNHPFCLEETQLQLRMTLTLFPKWEDEFRDSMDIPCIREFDLQCFANQFAEYLCQISFWSILPQTPESQIIIQQLMPQWTAWHIHLTTHFNDLFRSINNTYNSPALATQKFHATQRCSLRSQYLIKKFDPTIHFLLALCQYKFGLLSLFPYEEWKAYSNNAEFNWQRQQPPRLSLLVGVAFPEHQNQMHTRKRRLTAES